MTRRAEATQYQIDVGRSRMSFKATAFLLMPVKGTFTPDSGQVRVEGDRLIAEGSAPTKTVDTGIGVRDWHLRHKHYLHADAHPSVRFVADVPATGSGRATATVYARGESVPVELTVDEVAIDGDELRVHAHGSFDRTGLRMLPRQMGVSRMIGLDLDLVATRAA